MTAISWLDIFTRKNQWGWIYLSATNYQGIRRIIDVEKIAE